MSAQLGEEIAIQQTLAASERGDVAAVRYWSERFANHYTPRFHDGVLIDGIVNRYYGSSAASVPLWPLQTTATKPRGRRKAK